MKHRCYLVAGIALCCLVILLSRRRLSATVPLRSSANTAVLIEAVHYEGASYMDADEAVALRNNSAGTVDISAWSLSDGNMSTVVIPNGTKLAPQSLAWITRDPVAFHQQFGTPPDVVISKWPGFANDGDEVLLLDTQGRVVDTVVYGDGDTTTTGWIGSSVQPYTVRGVFGARRQILSRKTHEHTGLPIDDCDCAADWSQDQDDVFLGRRVRFPGWDMEAFFFPVHDERPSYLTVAVAPDNAYETLLEQIRSAQASLSIATLTFENHAIATALSEVARRGVKVKMLLEGGPVGGISDQEKALCQMIESAGAECWFMVSDQDNHIFNRYQFAHAKYIITDQKTALISSENLSPNSMPADDKSDGTWGRRGVILATDSPEVVDTLSRVFAADLDPGNHRDLFRWQSEHPSYGAPAPSFVPIQESGGITYTVLFPAAATFNDARSFELQQAPENLLRYEDGILGLINKATVGDTLLIQQLQERPYWGNASSNRIDDPNLRLEALIEAARRGATVRFVLDSYFDDPRSPVSNTATCAELSMIAQNERLNLECQLANPTGLGIHNKMILAQIDGRGYVHVGSWNGTELASKGNREVTLLVQSDGAYTYLANMFEGDRPHLTFVPLILSHYRGPADHALISEVMYDPSGTDETEFIELVNPTEESIDLGGASLGDAVSRENFEDVRRFPDGTRLERGEVLVVTLGGMDFFEAYHLWPDFEILDTTPLVPNLIDDPSWGDPAALLQLGNQGDEVILRDRMDSLIDVVTYGSGTFPGQVSCPLLISTNHSLERFPYWNDSDNCPEDFRDWPFPTPGSKP